MRTSREAPVWWRALRVSLLYAGVSTVWIFASDRLLALLLRDPDRIAAVSSAKGALFVVVTASLLYLLLSRLLTRRESALFTRDGTGAEPEEGGSRFRA